MQSLLWLLISVAPFAGAWIEIWRRRRESCSAESLPSRERGLKYRKNNCEWLVTMVAPFAGAWIEISITVTYNYITYVAPFAGAWIEIIL